MTITRAWLKECLRPQVAQLLRGLQGQVTLNGEAASAADITVLVTEVCRREFEQAYARSVERTGYDSPEVHDMLPELIAELCGEERARQTH